MRAMSPFVATMIAEHWGGVEQLLRSLCLCHPEVVFVIAQPDGVRVVVCLLAPDNIDLKPVLVYCRIFLGIPDTECPVNFLKHAQHRTVDLAQCSRKCDPLAHIPQQVNVTGRDRSIVKYNAGRRLVCIQCVRADHAEVFGQLGGSQAIEDVHDDGGHPPNPQRPIRPLVFCQRDFQTVTALLRQFHSQPEAFVHGLRVGRTRTKEWGHAGHVQCRMLIAAIPFLHRLQVNSLPERRRPRSSRESPACRSRVPRYRRDGRPACRRRHAAWHRGAAPGMALARPRPGPG